MRFFRMSEKLEFQDGEKSSCTETSNEPRARQAEAEAEAEAANGGTGNGKIKKD